MSTKFLSRSHGVLAAPRAASLNRLRAVWTGFATRSRTWAACAAASQPAVCRTLGTHLSFERLWINLLRRDNAPIGASNSYCNLKNKAT